MASIDLRKFIGLQGTVFTARWEHAFDTVYTSFEEIIQRQFISGVLLLSCAVIALVVANAPLSDACQHLLHTHFSLGFGFSELVFAATPQVLLFAKAGVLAISLIAGIAGAASLYGSHTEMEEE